jgi:hypothetical protein
MKNKQADYLAITLFLTVFFLGGCGKVGNADSPGVTMTAIITPTYNGGNYYSVDVVQDICTQGSTTQLEYFADHTATASFSASLINPSAIIPQLTVYLDGYTITYQRHADSPGAPPILEDTRTMTDNFIVSSASSTTGVVTATVLFVDVKRKIQYYSDAGGALNNYTATYTFHAHGENGVPFTFNASADFQIGNINYCPTGYTPF